VPTPEHVKRMNTAEIREIFLADGLFTPGEITLVYSHTDRMVIGGAVPVDGPLALVAGEALAAEYFAERREIGVFNIGGAGTVRVANTDYPTARLEMVYISRGSQAVSFSSDDPGHPAQFYLVSVPAHTAYPTTHIPIDAANQVALGSQDDANKRTIYQYVHEEGVPSCQLVMGFTQLEPGNVWNTMPAHTHDRRSEVYLYFDLEDDNVVFHFMGEGAETRHLVLRNGDAVISPSWSIHAGAGTRNYCFIWAMGGENQAFNDMDAVPLRDMA
jgi:4-deoxy-L-threo-5-hexosulose-uronate ketol-isomerase